MKAVRVHSHGGPEVLSYEDAPIPKVEPGKVLIKNFVCGVNFIDIYHRSGVYKVELPYTLGRDGAGIVEEIGEGVDSSVLKKGDRVAFGPTGSGSYAEYTLVSFAHAVKLPDGISFEHGCASMVQGLTAHALVKGAYYVKKGDTVLVQAVAGGLGNLICQMCKILGATVIGTTSTPEKAELAKQAGCDHVILYTEKDVETEVKRITNGKGVNVVFDGVGKDTWEKSLNSLGRRGMLVLCGNASGKVPAIDPLLLSQKGSLFLTRPTLFDYVYTREEMVERSTEVFNWILSGQLKISLMPTLKLSEAAKAHAQLEGRQTVGKLILTP